MSMFFHLSICIIWGNFYFFKVSKPVEKVFNITGMDIEHTQIKILFSRNGYSIGTRQEYTQNKKSHVQS